MKCTSARMETFSYDLKQPLSLGGEPLTVRQGLWLWLEDEAGHVARGEIAPLPGVSVESFDAAQEQVTALLPKLTERSLFELNTEDCAPSVQFGLDMARTELIWLSQPQAPVWAGRAVRLNGLVIAQNNDVESAVTSLLEAGYASIKVKVGRQSVAEDIQAVGELRQKLKGRATLRLDANRSWTRDQALEFGQALGGEQIEYIEEPCLLLKDQTAFYEATQIPLALDESLLTMAERTLANVSGVAAFILKPALLGPLHRSLSLATMARAQGIPVVFSSLFESPHALNFYARCACQCGVSHVPQGLDTWRWLVGAEQEMKVQQGAIVFGGECT